MVRVLAIIQARISSTRLPGKTLFPLKDKTVLEHVIMRVKASKTITDMIVATTLRKEDLKIAHICKKLSVKTFRGSTDDVLNRFYQAALRINPAHVVRITGDCPAIDPKVIDKVVSRHLAERADYTSNTVSPTYPDGEDVEVFKISALEDAWKNAKLASEREHVTPYIKKNAKKFKIINVRRSPDLSDRRWTLDEKTDYEFLKIIFDKLYTKNNTFGMEEVLKLLKKNPRLEKINKNIMRNEGYIKSLRNDVWRNSL